MPFMNSLISGGSILKQMSIFMNKSSLAFLVIVFVVLTGCASPQHKPSINHQVYFDDMKKRLSGRFVEATDKDGWVVEYTLMSKNTVLSETWIAPSGNTELTLFFMDKETLLATHFCASGIQSTMALMPPSGIEDELKFTVRSTTNLKSADQAHNSGFAYVFLDNNQVKRTEQWKKSDNESHSELILQPE